MKLVNTFVTVDALVTGYLSALHETLSDVQEDIHGTDTWIEFAEYDINICGAGMSEDAPEGGLVAYVYPAGWKDDLPECLFIVTKTFTGEQA